jgi:hypothetical protein
VLCQCLPADTDSTSKAGRRMADAERQNIRMLLLVPPISPVMSVFVAKAVGAEDGAALQVALAASGWLQVGLQVASSWLQVASGWLQVALGWLQVA